MIKVLDVKGLARCPICGSEVELRRNSGKRFQIKCTNPVCYVRTAWLSKTTTLCTWSEITARLARSAFDPEGRTILQNNLQSEESTFRDRNQRIVRN